MKKRNIAFMAGVLALGLFVSLLPQSASAASSSEIKAQISALEDQLEALQAQMDELEQQIQDNVSEMQEIVDQKNRIDQQVFLLHEQIANINDQISAYRVLIADKQEELDAAQAQFEALHEKYQERIRAMEEEGKLSYWSVLFKANSFADLLDRLNMIEEIAAADQRRLQEVNAAAQRVADTQAALEAEKAELEKTKAELDASQSALEKKRAQADQLLNDLRAKGEDFEIYMAEAEQEQNELMLQIAAQEAAYNEAVEQEYWATYVPSTTTAPVQDNGNNDPTDSSADPSISATWLTPVPYYTLTSPFGMRIDPVYGGWAMHYGVDLACAEGTPIYASRSGTVTIASSNDLAGNYVNINHGDGYSSIYMHMTYYIVSVGEYVSAGQVIGYVGSTGKSTGNHLHFGIAYNGTYVNPMDYI